MVRTPASHADNRGSNPRRVARKVYAPVCRLPSKQEKANWTHGGSNPLRGAKYVRSLMDRQHSTKVFYVSSNLTGRTK